MGQQAKQVVLVTGASSGLGKAISERLLKENHIVFGTGRSWVTGNAAGELQQIQMDVSDDASVRKAIEHIVARAGRLDVLVNNAGIGIQGPAEDTPIAVAQTAFETNFFGMHRVIRQVLPVMRKQGAGTIINISSIAANMGLPYRAFYSASKAAVDKYSEALSMEVHPWNIQVTCIEPGDFKSNISESRVKPQHISEDYSADYQACMRKLNELMNHAPSPNRIVNRVVKVVAGNSTGFRYRVGKPLEKLAVHLRYWLPASLFQGMLRKFSGN